MEENKVGKGKGKGLIKIKMKRSVKLPTKKERMLMLKEAREKGIITIYPKFIPPPEPIPLPMTPEEQDMLLEHMLSHRESISVQHEFYSGPAQAPGELSLPEKDAQVRELLYAALEVPKRKKKRVVSIGKQKRKVASSSKKQKTNS